MFFKSIIFVVFQVDDDEDLNVPDDLSEQNVDFDAEDKDHDELWKWFQSLV